MILDRILFGGHLHTNEKLRYVVHQHWFAIYRSITKVGFFGMLLPVIFYLVFPVGFWFWVGWLIVGLVVFFYEVVDWYFDAILITNHSIVHLNWRGIFDKSSHRADFEIISGVIYEKTGFWSNLFNFGPLLIDKEGTEEERIYLSHAINPFEAEREVLLAKEEYMHENALESEQALKEILSNMVAEHVRRERDKTKIADLL